MPKADRKTAGSPPLSPPQGSGRPACLPGPSAERRQAGTPAAKRGAAFSARRPLRLGFLALTDAAPLVVAQERGFFARYGLTVVLEREVGWATIREKIIYGELDGAQALAPMLWATHLGLDCAATPVLAAFVFNLHGNAITLSAALRDAGVRDVGSLRLVAKARRGESRLTLGVVFPFSTHHLHLRQWLEIAGIRPEHDVRIVVVPPAQMFRNLQAGTIDGYCAGEPWNSIAVRARAGWCPAWSAAQAPGHLEKVLMVTARFAERRAPEHAALVAALADAAAWCDEPANREPLAAMLAAAPYLNLPERVIRPALAGRFDCGDGRVADVPDFFVFHRGEANAPAVAKAAALQRELVSAGILPAGLDPELPRRLFREDLYREFLQPHHTHAHVSPSDLSGVAAT
ncbi:MAG TPA: CmpA/NrtA family ABC transporter substrate-binding protein [Opitutus sp.]|nr:CmpA/NrtA family ABC transporter substrate-binding protein [Opitutus sp.]